jgi:DNA polymerase-3 subunit delta'
LATGGSKAVKELEKEQNARNKRIVRDNLERELLDLATIYKDVLLIQFNSMNQITNKDLQNRIKQKAEDTSPEVTINSINSILKARSNLIKNSAHNITTEALLINLEVD